MEHPIRSAETRVQPAGRYVGPAREKGLAFRGLVSLWKWLIPETKVCGSTEEIIMPGNLPVDSSLRSRVWRGHEVLWDKTSKKEAPFPRMS